MLLIEKPSLRPAKESSVSLNIKSARACTALLNFLNWPRPYPALDRKLILDSIAIMRELLDGANDSPQNQYKLLRNYYHTDLGDSRTKDAILRWVAKVR